MITFCTIQLNSGSLKQIPKACTQHINIQPVAAVMTQCQVAKQIKRPAICHRQLKWLFMDLLIKNVFAKSVYKGGFLFPATEIPSLNRKATSEFIKHNKD